MPNPKKSGEATTPPEKPIAIITIKAHPVPRYPPLDYQPKQVTASERPIKTSSLGIVAPIYEDTK